MKTTLDGSIPNYTGWTDDEIFEELERIDKLEGHKAKPFSELLKDLGFTENDLLD